jgi:two-component system LytT family response regulator
MKNVLILDDIEVCRNTLQNHLLKFYPSITNIVFCSSLKELKEVFKSDVKFDLAFLDIELQDGLVFEVLDDINTSIQKIIFTTAFRDYAIKAFSYSATDYILKPVEEDEFVKAVNKAEKELMNSFYEQQIHLLKEMMVERDKEPENILISSQTKLHILPIKNIVWAKAREGYCEFKMKDSVEHLSSKPLKEYQSGLIEQGFIRIHNSYMVNKKYILSLVKGDGGGVEMSNGSVLPISRRRKEDVLDRIKGSI